MEGVALQRFRTPGLWPQPCQLWVVRLRLIDERLWASVLGFSICKTRTPDHQLSLNQDREFPYKTCYFFHGRWVQQDVHGGATVAQEAWRWEVPESPLKQMALSSEVIPAPDYRQSPSLRPQPGQLFPAESTCTNLLPAPFPFLCKPKIPKVTL